MTVMPSYPMASSRYLTPPFLQAACSSGSIALDASLICVSPLQNRTKPSVVPGPSTLICTAGFCAENCSATSWLIGSTVDDPETLTDPETPLELPPPPELFWLSPGLFVEEAAPSNAKATSPTAASRDIFLIHVLLRRAINEEATVRGGRRSPLRALRSLLFPSCVANVGVGCDRATARG